MIDTTTQKIALQEATTWFTADTHVGHGAAIKFCNRPFTSVEEMDEAIWRGLKEHVGPEDTLVHLGDVTWNIRNDDDVQKLPGRHRILVKGNHDKQAVPKSKRWSRVCDRLEATVMFDNGSKKKVVMDHYPLISWNGARTSIHLHGHTHSVIAPVATEFGGRYDAGVDVWGFKPFRLRDVIARLDKLREQGFARPGDY